MKNIVQEYTKALDELTAIAAQLTEEELDWIREKEAAVSWQDKGRQGML